MKKQFLSAAAAAVLTVFTAQAAFAVELNTLIRGSDLDQGGGHRLDKQAANADKVAEQFDNTNGQVNRNTNAIAESANALQAQGGKLDRTAALLDTANAQVNKNTSAIAEGASALRTQAETTAAQLSATNGQVNKNTRAIAETKDRLDGREGNFNDYDGDIRTIEKVVSDHEFGIDRAIKQGERNVFTIGKLDERIRRLENGNAGGN